MAKFVQGWFPTAMVAAAETIVMLTGGIDLSVGPMVSLGSVVAASTMQGPLGIFGGVLALLALGAGVGAIVGAFVAIGRYPAIIVTLALSFVLRGVALLIMPRPGGFVPPSLSEFLAGSHPTAAVLVVLLVILWKLYQATPLGIGLIAVGDNAEGAYRSGVSVTTVRMSAYIISGILQAFTGLYVAAQTGSGDPLIGEPLTLSAIAAAVLGGVGFLGGQGAMRGALAGSLLMSILINVMFFLGLPLVAQYVVQGLIIVATVALPLIPRLFAEGVLNAVLRLQRFAATYSRSLVAYAIVAILWIAASLLIAGFGAYAHLRYIVELAAVIGLVGIGQTVAVIGGGIDLSVAAVITVTAIILPLVTFDADATGLGAIALALLVAGGIGAVNGLGIGYLGPAAADHDLGHGDDPARAPHPHCGRERDLGHQPRPRLARFDACADDFGQHHAMGDRRGRLLVLVARNAQRFAHLRHRRQSGGQPTVGRAHSPTDTGHLCHLRVLRRPRRPSAPVDEWARLCRHRRSVLIVVDRGGGARRHLDPWRPRHISWHDRRSSASGDDDGVDHGRERLGGLAQRHSRLPDFGYAAIVGSRPVALRMPAGAPATSKE